jgi:hypothetical protein
MGCEYVTVERMRVALPSPSGKVARYVRIWIEERRGWVI